jgi:hypothetical protein
MGTDCTELCENARLDIQAAQFTNIGICKLSLGTCRAALAKMEEDAVEASQEVREAAEQEQEAAAALVEGDEKLHNLKAQQEELKALVDREAQDAQVLQLF